MEPLFFTSGGGTYYIRYFKISSDELVSDLSIDLEILALTTLGETADIDVDEQEGGVSLVTCIYITGRFS